MIAARFDDEPTPEFNDPNEEMIWRIARANLVFLRTYRDNADLIAVIEQAVLFSDELREIRREARAAFVDRAERAIERMQARGIAYGDVDPHYAAHALGAMVDRFAYVTYVLGDAFEIDEAARTLGLMWARALGLDAPDGIPIPHLSNATRVATSWAAGTGRRRLRRLGPPAARGRRGTSARRVAARSAARSPVSPHGTVIAGCCDRLNGYENGVQPSIDSGVIASVPGSRTGKAGMATDGRRR